jgi:hypothetical protein
MAFTFAAQHPTFGTKNNRSPLSYQQRSPYYWWWAYLRKNDKYIACCANEGEGELAELYKDFGDVRGDEFRLWWNLKGAQLFGDFTTPDITELKDKAEWQDGWKANEILVLAVPLAENKRDLQRQFAKLLKKRHAAKRGRTAGAWDRGNAKYKINRNFTIDSLRTAFTVYEEYLNNQARPKSDRLTLWEMGVKLRLVPTAMPAKTDGAGDNTVKRNTMAVSVNRYIQQAKKIVAGTAAGVFPK